MSHSHSCLLIHAVFATKERFAFIPAELFESLWAFTGGIARKNGMKALAIGGTSDHMHVLLSIPATMPVAKALQLIKAGSSKFMNEHIQHRFEWQEGYGAFFLGSGAKISHGTIHSQSGRTSSQTELCGTICSVPRRTRATSRRQRVNRPCGTC
jgi:REP element-mobilizing transposase RayT